LFRTAKLTLQHDYRWVLFALDCPLILSARELGAF
jgi:hypothetical protein